MKTTTTSTTVTLLGGGGCKLKPLKFNLIYPTKQFCFESITIRINIHTITYRMYHFFDKLYFNSETEDTYFYSRMGCGHLACRHYTTACLWSKEWWKNQTTPCLFSAFALCRERKRERERGRGERQREREREKGRERERVRERESEREREKER